MMVALPLASSSPYPTPSRQDWALHRSPAQTALSPAPSGAPPQASNGSFSLASASSVPVPRKISEQFSLAPAAPVPAESDIAVPLVNTVRTVSIRRPIGDAPEVAPEPRIVTASLGGHLTGEPPYEERPAVAPTLPEEIVVTAPVEHPSVEPTRPRSNGTMNEVDDYLWEVYQRSPTKRDRGGDFTWKDPAAAARVGKTLQAYVIQGMDPDLREIMYHAGKAMDAEGIEWTIVSAFRDDWRQSIASGLKARTGFSRHGGSRATGGYGHGRAVDVGHVDRAKSSIVFRWIDMNGAKYGISRPIRHFDPPHVEPRSDWRRIAAQLRRGRTGSAVAETPARPDETRPARAAKRVARAGRSLRGRRYR